MENSVWKLLSDLSLKKGVSEVIINSTDNVYIEKNSILIRLNVELKEQDLYEFCEQVAVQNNLKFGPENPIIDGTLQDGSRIKHVHSWAIIRPQHEVVVVWCLLAEVIADSCSECRFGFSS